MNTNRLNRFKQLFLENTSVKQIIVKNTFWLFFANIINKFFKFFLVVYAARILGPTNYGTFIYTMSLFGTIFLFSDIGIGGLLVREYQKKESDNNKLVSTAIAIRLCLWFIVSLISIIIFYFIEDLTVKSIFFWLLLLFSIQHFREICINLARANNKMQYEGLIIIVDTIITTCLGLFLLNITSSILFLTIAYITGATLGLIVGVLATYQYFVSFKFFNLIYTKKILSIVWPFAFGSIISIVLLNTDILLLGIFKDKTVVGQYSAGARIISVLNLIPVLFGTALFPIFSKYHEEKEKLTNILKICLKYILILSIPITVGGIIIARALLLKFYGYQYMEGVPSFQILLLTIPFLFITIILDNLLFATNHQIQNMIFTAIAAFANLALDLILIPIYSLHGAAIATIIAQILNFALTLTLTKKILQQNFISWNIIIQIIPAIILMVLTITATAQFQMPILFTIIIAILIYTIVLIYIDKKNEESIFKAIKNIYNQLNTT